MGQISQLKNWTALSNILSKLFWVYCVKSEEVISLSKVLNLIKQ